MVDLGVPFSTCIPRIIGTLRSSWRHYSSQGAGNPAQLDLKPMITVFPLDDAVKAFASTKRAKRLKISCRPSSSYATTISGLVGPGQHGDGLVAVGQPPVDVGGQEDGHREGEVGRNPPGAMRPGGPRAWPGDARPCASPRMFGQSEPGPEPGGLGRPTR